MSSDDICDLDGAWRIKINSMEKEFNKKRSKFYNDVNRYFRRSVYSTYNDELYLSNQLIELRKLRDEINSFKKSMLNGVIIDNSS